VTDLNDSVDAGVEAAKAGEKPTTALITETLGDDEIEK
jgi:hypothetical protein